MLKFETGSSHCSMLQVHKFKASKLFVCFHFVFGLEGLDYQCMLGNAPLYNTVTEDKITPEDCGTADLSCVTLDTQAASFC